MVELAEIQAAYYMVAATGVLVAAIYYVYNMRTSKRSQELALKTQEQTLETRQAQLFRDLLKTQETYEFTKMSQELFYEWTWKDFDDYMVKYGTSSADARTKATIVFGYLEGMGILVRRGLISPELVYEFNYNLIIGFWDKYRPIVVGWREMFKSPQFYEPIEWLYGEMKRIQVSRGHGFDTSDFLDLLKKT